MTRAFVVLAAALLSMGLTAHGSGALAQTSQPMTSGADMVPVGVDAPTQQRWLAFQQQEAQQFQSLLRQQTARPAPLAQGTQSLEGPRQQQDQIVKPSPRQLQARAQLDALFKQGFRTEAERQQAAQLFEQGHWTLKTFARGTQLQAAQQQLPLVQRQIKAKQDEVLRLTSQRDQQKAQLRVQKTQDIAALTKRLQEQRSREGTGSGPSDNAAAAQIADLNAMYQQREQALDLQFARQIATVKAEIEELQQQATILQQQIRTLQAS